MQDTSIAQNEICLDPEDEFQISQVLEPEIFNHYLQLFDSGDTSLKNEQNPEQNPSKEMGSNVNYMRVFLK